MKNLLKLSLITSMLLSTQLMAWTESETETRVNVNKSQSEMNKTDIQQNKEDSDNYKTSNDSKISSMESDISTLKNDVWTLKQSSGGGSNPALENQVNQNMFNIDEINKTTSGSDVDGIDVSKSLYGTYDVNYGSDDVTINVDKKGAFDELYGTYQTNVNYDTGEETKTLVEDGLIQKVDYLMNNQGSTDLTQVNNDINQNTTLATDAKDIAITAQDKANLNSSDITSIKAKNIAQDGVINQNVVNIADNKTAIQTTNLRVNTFDSRITSNNNLSQSNKTRLDNKDIKDSEQDKRLDALEKNNNADLEKTLMNERAITRKLINQGIAMNNAMNIPLDFTYSDKIIGVGVGAYNGEYALGTVMAWQYKNTTISVKAGIDGDKNVGASGSITIGF